MMNKDNPPIVSVVIATYNRRLLLPALFEALAAQTLPPALFEVIIVDDCSPDATAETIRELTERTPLVVTYVRQEVNGGPAQARNAGVRRARGAIVSFTDDDCCPCPQWLEELLRPFGDESVVGVEGPVITDPERVCAFTQALANDTPGAYFTANVAYRRNKLLDVGLFDECYPFPADEDVDLGLRMLQQGRIAFNPEAVVFHPPVPIGIVKHARRVRYTVSDVRFFLKHPSRITKPYRYLWMYAVRNVVVGDIKSQLSFTPLLRRDPKRYAGYLLLHVLRLYYTLTLIPEYRRREASERRSLGME